MWTCVLSSSGIQGIAALSCCFLTVTADPLLQEPVPEALPFDWMISSNINLILMVILIYVTLYFFTDYLKFGLFFFPIALPAVPSMDHSFDGISIKMEEGAYQRKANS